MLLQLDILTLINTDHVATFALPLIAIMNAIVLCDSFLPAVPQLALPDLDVLEYLGLALSTLDSQHLEIENPDLLFMTQTCIKTLPKRSRLYLERKEEEIIFVFSLA